MKSSVRLARIAGIDIGLHYTWFVVPALVAWSLARGLLPDRYPGWAGPTYWGAALFIAVLLSLSVLVHEMAHSLVARRLGLPAGGITLFLLGGVSDLEGEPRRPRDELVISAVGPLTSFLLAGIFAALILAVGEGGSPVDAILVYAARINLLLGAFNLLPALPLDGGRVLRSVVWAATGNPTLATGIASVSGQLLGIGLMAIGVYALVTGYALGGISLVFLGWFLRRMAAESRASSREDSEAARHAMDGVERYPLP